jgi:RNA polymerase sigma-70 factor (ECF subfamily)
MPVHLDDRRLVKRLRAGDAAAFNQFFDDHFARLYRFVLPRAAHDEEAAKEIVQAALSRALRNISRYRAEAALFTWLCSIARNEMVDWMRRNARYHEHIVLIEDAPEIRAAVDSFLAPPADEPGGHLQTEELRRLIQVALDRLPARYGNALEWKYIQGHSVKEIARRLQLSPDAAQSLLARARRAFGDVYAELARPITHEAQG